MVHNTRRSNRSIRRIAKRVGSGRGCDFQGSGSSSGSGFLGSGTVVVVVVIVIRSRSMPPVILWKLNGSVEFLWLLQS